MKQAIFITGFNNWGKTSIIQHLFNDRQRYFYGSSYRIEGINADFTVETHSNDDYGGIGWLNLIINRLSRENRDDLSLFTALCPTLQDENNFIELLNNQIFNDYQQLNVFLIENKWEHHATLNVNNIVNAGNGIRNINFININVDGNLETDEERWNAKIDQIIMELRRLF